MKYYNTIQTQHSTKYVYYHLSVQHNCNFIFLNIKVCSIENTGTYSSVSYSRTVCFFASNIFQSVKLKMPKELSLLDYHLFLESLLILKQLQHKNGYIAQETEISIACQ